MPINSRAVDSNNTWWAPLVDSSPLRARGERQGRWCLDGLDGEGRATQGVHYVYIARVQANPQKEAFILRFSSFCFSVSLFLLCSAVASLHRTITIVSPYSSNSLSAGWLFEVVLECKTKFSMVLTPLGLRSPVHLSLLGQLPSARGIGRGT